MLGWDWVGPQTEPLASLAHQDLQPWEGSYYVSTHLLGNLAEGMPDGGKLFRGAG